MIRFIQLTPTRYISASKFSLIKYKDYYQILCNSKVPRWNCKFSSIECAENFLNSHNYIHASADVMPMSSDDIEFIIDMYGFNNVGRNKWTSGDITLKINRAGNGVVIDNKKFNDAIDAIDYLDSITSSVQLVKCSTLSELKERIVAANDRRSAREITKNLVRVKSSNLWAYMIDIKDRHDRTGTVYIQFKGRNGGPGDIYAYADVPVNVWRQLISSPSKGHAFWKLIRNNYLYKKLTGDKRTHLRNGV